MDLSYEREPVDSLLFARERRRRKSGARPRSIFGGLTTSHVLRDVCHRKPSRTESHNRVIAGLCLSVPVILAAALLSSTQLCARIVLTFEPPNPSDVVDDRNPLLLAPGHLHFTV